MNMQLKKFQEAADKAEQEFLAAVNPEPEPEPEPSPETTPESAPEPEPPAPSAEDEKYKAAVRAMNEAQRKAAEAARREEEFTREKQALEAKLQEALERAERIAEAAKAQPAEEDDLESDMPEVARIAERKAKKALTPLEQRLADIEKKLEEERTRNKELEKQTRAEMLYKEVKQTHPDYEDLVASDDMQAWINTEAPPIYKAIFEGSVPMTARDAIAVLNAFKATRPAPKTATAPTDTKAPVKAPPAINTQPQTKKLPTEAEMVTFSRNIHRMTPEQIAEFEARLEA